MRDGGGGSSCSERVLRFWTSITGAPYLLTRQRNGSSLSHAGILCIGSKHQSECDYPSLSGSFNYIQGQSPVKEEEKDNTRTHGRPDFSPTL